MSPGRVGFGEWREDAGIEQNDLDLWRSMDFEDRTRQFQRTSRDADDGSGRRAPCRDRKGWWWQVLLPSLLLLPAGCDKKTPGEAIPSFEERRAQRPWATATSLQEGARLHRERCLDCHGQAPRDLYTPDRWREIVDAMAERSRLDTLQSRLVLDWILVGDSLEEGAPGK